MHPLKLEGQLVEMLVDVDLDVMRGMREVGSGCERDADVELGFGGCELEE